MALDLVVYPKILIINLSAETALAKVAFYRFYFLLGSSASLELLETQKIVEVELTSFAAQINTKKGIDLTLHPFDKYKADISSAISYELSQKLGSTMREAEIEAFLSTGCYKEGK